MKTILKNNQGSSLVSVLVIGSILITSGMFILEQTKVAQKRKIQIEYKIQENQIEDTLIQTLSNKEICTNIFNGHAAANATQLQFNQLSDLKDKIKNETKSNSAFENLDYEVTSIDIVSSLTNNQAKNIDSGKANLNIKVIRDNKVSFMFNNKKTTQSVKQLKIPIVFEFDSNSAISKLMSCYAITSNDSEFTLAANQNCIASGGSLNPNQKCVFKVNELKWNSTKRQFSVDTENNLDLQDLLCKVDNSVTQKLKNVSKDELYSEFCPKVQFNGCIVNGVKHKNGDHFSYEYQGNKSSVYDRANSLQYQSSYLRYLRFASEFELAGLDFSKTNMSGRYINQNSTSKSGIATGVAASVLVGSVLSGGFMLAPLLILKMEEWICGNKHKARVRSHCVDGKEEMIDVQIDKRRMKKFKCRWKSDGIVAAESDNQIIKNLTGMINGQLTNVTPTYSQEAAVELDEQKFKDLTEQKKEFRDVLNNYANITNIDSFYEQVKDFKTESSEKLVGQDYEGMAPEAIDLEKYIDQEIRKLEIQKWDDLRNSIKKYNYSSQTYSEVSSNLDRYKNSINNSGSKLIQTNPNETSNLASEDMTKLQKNILSTIESRVNAAKTLAQLESYGDPSALKGSMDSSLNPELDKIVSKYKGLKETLKKTRRGRFFRI